MSHTYALAEKLGKFLLKKGERLTTVESCTGGWLAKCLTDVPGSSNWFEGGWITYSNEMKKHLGVPDNILELHGAVSSETAVAMVQAALKKSQASISVSITGIAGPSGETLSKAIGLVFIALGIKQNDTIETQWRRYNFYGSREAIRLQTVHTALLWLLEKIDRK